jgi:hypothetical protein
MTKHEQNELIIQSLERDLMDKPDVQAKITAIFTKWFQNLVVQGQELIAAATPPPAAAGTGGEEPTPEGGQA